MSNGFTFHIGVGTTHYDGKCNEWGKLRYRIEKVTVDSLVDYISQGYCFTHTFNNVSADGTWGCREKTIKNFKSTNTIFIDVDGCSLTASDFFTTISPQPTIQYTTPSNVDGENNRFRLVYVYSDKITSNETYKREVNKICNSIIEYIPSFKFDTTSVNVSQQMGGNGSSGCLLYMTHNIFNFSSFKDIDCISITYKKEERNDIENRKAGFFNEEGIEIVDKEFERAFWDIDSEDSVYTFISTYGDIYPIYEVTQVDADVPYIALNDGSYVEISRRYYVTKDEWDINHYIPVKIKEGNRERILFSNALLRLKMNPEMSFENLLFALVYERQFWIDNSDGEFNNRTLYKIAKGAYLNRDRYQIASATQGQLRRRAKTNKNGYKVNKAYCDKHGKSVRTMANLMRGDIANNILLENYDFDKCVAENSKLLKEKGIKPNSERRLYVFKQWCKNNNIYIR